MEIYENKALLLHLKNPHKVTSVIPKSAVVGVDGPVTKVLVNWGLDEARVLKNLGIKDVPSPIKRRYKWPGMYTPFQHQEETAAFLTLHPRAYVFNDPGCVDSETEYLSPTGWVKISEYSGGKVAQYHEHSGEVEFVEPEAYVKKPCDTMLKVKTNYGLDQMLSPEHRVLLHDYKAKFRGSHKTEVLSASELMERHENYHNKITHKKSATTIGFSSAAIPTTFRAGGAGIALTDDLLRVQVAVIADGHFPNNTNYCVVRLKKDRKVSRLRELLVTANIEFRERLDQSETGVGFTVFSFYAPRRDKVFNDYYWDASTAQLALIADEIQHWDSCVTRGFRFSSYVKASADFVQFAVSSTGRTARVLTNTRERRGATETEYVVQVRPETCLVMKGPDRNLSWEASTDGYKYCFTVPTSFLLFRRNGCVFASGNTGKTMACAWASDYLLQQKAIKRVLIICPMSVMQPAWLSDLFRCVMHRKADIAHGSKAKRVEVINSDAEYVIINFDGVETCLEELKNGGFDLIIIDEANAIKTHTTSRWKSINKLQTPETWMWLLTGTPASQSPTDAYGLAKMLNPSSVPQYFGAFRDQVMRKVTQFKWAPKPEATDRVHKILQPAIRFAQEDCLDLPELLYTSREVQMTPQQKMYYNKLKAQMLIEASGESVTAVNAAVKLNKLLQISAGSVITDDGQILEFDAYTKYEELLAVINQATHKFLLAVPFRAVIDVLHEKLKADGINVGIVHGGVSATARSTIFNDFQTTDKFDGLVIQPAAAAHGVTLHAANNTIWWGPVSSYEIYTQFNKRMHRAGQKNACLVTNLYNSPVEKKMYQALQAREETMFDLLALYKEVLDES